MAVIDSLGKCGYSPGSTEHLTDLWKSPETDDTVRDRRMRAANFEPVVATHLHCRLGPWLCSGADVGEIIVSGNAGLANRRFRVMVPTVSDGSRALSCVDGLSAVSPPCSLTQRKFREFLTGPLLSSAALSVLSRLSGVRAAARDW